MAKRKLASPRVKTPPFTRERLRAYRKDIVRFLEEQYVCQSALTGRDEVVKLEPWQKKLLRDAFRTDPKTGLRLHNLIVIGLAKKNGKSSLGSMIGTWAAFCDEAEGEIVVVANDKDQASSITFKGIKRAIQKNETLASECKIGRYLIEIPATGTVVRAIANDPEGEAGNRASCTIFDELWGQKDRKLFDELTLNPIRRQPFAVITTYAGWDRESLLYEIYEAGTRGDDPRMYFHWREGLEAANPASWVTDEYLEQQRRRMPPQVFNRFHRNMWSAPDEPFVTEAQVAACTTGAMAERCDPHFSYVLTCDLGMSKDRTAVAVLHRDYPRGRVVLDYMQAWEGSQAHPVLLADVQVRLEQLHALYRPRWCVFDAWEMRAFNQAHAGWNITEFSFTGSAMYDMATVLYQSIANTQLELYPSAGAFIARNGIKHDLQRELPNLILVETPRGFKFDHQVGKHNDLSVALGMGVWRLMSDTAGAPLWKAYYQVESTLAGGPVLSPDAQWVRKAREEGLEHVDIGGRRINLRTMVPVQRTRDGYAVVYDR